MANPFQVSYFVCLLRAVWARCLALLSFVSSSPPSRNREAAAPGANPPPATSFQARGDLESQAGEGSWQAEKAQFMRSPSLLRSGSTFPPTATDNYLKKKSRRAAKASAVTSNPQVGVLDWKSLDYKISVPPLPDSSAPSFHRPFPPKSAPVVTFPSATPPPTILLPSPDLPLPPTPTPEIAIATPLDDHTTGYLPKDPRTNLADCTRISDQHALAALLTQSVFAPTSYASNPRSAVTGLLSDVPLSRVLRSIPLPQNCDPPKYVADPLAKAYCDVVPYPDLFDFAMYAKRASERISTLKRASGFPDLAHEDAPLDAACAGLPGARSFAFGVTSSEVADVCAPGLGLATPPLRIVKRGSERSASGDGVLRHSHQPSSASSSDCIHTSAA